jgi:hypothetical protein
VAFTVLMGMLSVSIVLVILIGIIHFGRREHSKIDF